MTIFGQGDFVASRGSRGFSGRVTKPLAEVLEARQLLATMTVNTTADSSGADGSSTLSLRQAIEISNGSLAIGSLSTAQASLVSGSLAVPNTIDFAIPGTGPFTISPTSALPSITRAVVIDGYSQAGAHPNTNGPRQGKNTGIEIELNGSQSGGAAGLDLKSGASTVEGLAIGGFSIGLVAEGSSNLVQGNFIGTDPTGTQALPNGQGIAGSSGMFIASSTNTTIGGTAAGDGNLISGNTTAGLGIIEGDLIQGNFIGTDITGTKALPNGEGSSFFASEVATVGGTVAGAGNLISGNTGDGLSVQDLSVVEGNLIGTDVTGTMPLPNGGVGVFGGGGDDFIGGTAAGAGNVISGNGGAGVSLQLDGYLIQGNFVGTDITGTKALPNGSEGISGISGNDTIGGTTAGAGNVISGNAGNGLTIFSGSLVEGNFIGTDFSGSKPIPNGLQGLYVEGSNDTIGGITPSAANVISGNGSDGILLGRSTLVEGNFIGTDLTGTKALPNQGNGVAVISGSPVYAFSVLNTIGGTAQGARNIISGNDQSGVVLGGQSLVEGNFIGTDITGTRPIRNGGIGIDVSYQQEGYGVYFQISYAGSNTIGGTAAGAGNVISGNTGIGLVLGPESLAQGNLIGTDVTGTQAIANDGGGIQVIGGGTTIGGTTAGAANIIAFNGFSGVDVLSQNDTISGNSIFDNQFGIDLGGDSVTPNQPVVVPTAPNQNQPYPVLNSASVVGNATLISSTLDASPSASYTIEFFASPTADLTGFGQGKTYLGSTVVTTDALGRSSFSFVSGQNLFGQVISATATDSTGNTSEFARDVTAGFLTTTELVGPSNPIATLGQATTFAAVVGSTVGGVPSGQVNFLEDGVVIGSAPLNASGIAVFITKSLSPGPHAITAAYAGDPTLAASQSSAVAISVFAPLAFGGPAVTSAKTVGPDSLTITFNRGLISGPAQDPTNYTIVGPNHHTIAIASAVYDAKTATVTLVTVQKLATGQSYQLTINGQKNNRIVDVFGIPLNGKHNGKPGHNYVGKIVGKKTSVVVKDPLPIVGKKVSIVKAAHPTGP